MNDGLISGINRNNRNKWYPQLLTVSRDGTGLTQPINIGTPLRNHGNWSFIDPNTIEAEWHMNHSYFVPEGVGQAYIIELPIPAKRWGGKNDDTTPQIVGFGRFIDFFHNPYSEIPLTISLADPTWFNLQGNANKFLQVYVPYTNKFLTGTWSANSSSATIAHTLEYKPEVTDLKIRLTSAPTGYYYTNLVGQTQASNGLTTTANRYWGLTSVVASASTSQLGVGAYIVVPGSSTTYTIDNLLINQDTASGVGVTRTYVVQKNGVDTALTLTISGNSQVTNSDTSHSFTCTSGDTLALRTSADATTANTGAIRWSVRASAPSNRNMSLSGGSQATASNSATSYTAVQGFFNNATLTNVEQVMPNAGTVQNSQCILTASPGAGTSYAFTLQKNGSDTTHTFTVSDANTTGSDTTHPITYVQGDRLAWKVVPSGTPTARGHFISINLVPTTAGESVHLYNGSSNMTNTVARYYAISQQASIGSNATESTRSVVTQAAIFKKLTAYIINAPGVGKSWQAQDYKNGSGVGSLTTTVSDTNQSNQDNTNSTSYSQGDTVSFLITPSGTPTATGGEVSMVSYIAPAPTVVDNILVTTDATNITLTAASGTIGTSDVTYGIHVMQEANYTNGGYGTMFYSPERPYNLGFPMEILLQVIYEVDN